MSGARELCVKTPFDVRRPDCYPAVPYHNVRAVQYSPGSRRVGMGAEVVRGLVVAHVAGLESPQ